MTGAVPTPSPLWQQWHDDSEEVRLGISSCLLGQKVRYDGGHKHDRYLAGVLGKWVSWVAVCPEVEIGLGVPRPTLRLEHASPAPRMVVERSREDLTQTMEEWARRRVSELQGLDLDGHVLKKSSPSCGMERVRVYREGSAPSKSGVGIYARVLMELWPNLPVEEEGRLEDPRLRERFIERIFCRHRWRTMVKGGLTRGRLVEFHQAHELLLRSHNEASYRRLGRIVSADGPVPDQELARKYEDELHACLKTEATPKRHASVLSHALGHLGTCLDPFEKQEAAQLIEDYRTGLAPLATPVALLRHHAHKHRVPYLMGQLYLEPHPEELMLLQ